MKIEHHKGILMDIEDTRWKDIGNYTTTHSDVPVKSATFLMMMGMLMAGLSVPSQLGDRTTLAIVITTAIVFLINTGIAILVGWLTDKHANKTLRFRSTPDGILLLDALLFVGGLTAIALIGWGVTMLV